MNRSLLSLYAYLSASLAVVCKKVLLKYALLALICQRFPEVCVSVKTDLFIWQKRPIDNASSRMRLRMHVLDLAWIRSVFVSVCVHTHSHTNTHTHKHTHNHTHTITLSLSLSHTHTDVKPTWHSRGQFPSPDCPTHCDIAPTKTDRRPGARPR